MTDEHAMKVWQEARAAAEAGGDWERGTSGLGLVWVDDDQAAAAVIAADRAGLVAEIERLREALEEIMGLPGEINPSNYDHDDVCELNRQFCYGYAIARAALKDTRHDT